MFTNIYDIDKLKPYNFSYQRWMAGSLSVFGIKTRTCFIELRRKTIRDYAIGYMSGEKLWVRPKKDTVAVMFWFNEQHFWTHLTTKEFLICFPELESFL